MRNQWIASWSVPFVVSKEGRIHHVDDVAGFIAEKESKPIGLITYMITNSECEITSLNSFEEGIGVGTSLINRLEESVKDVGCRRIWVITTNDNVYALRFYQKRGYRLVAIHRDAMIDVRKLKPDLPLLGMDDIPIRDMLELEKYT
jgi:ribosomal protein S18 acetylase RimI-like enzyme